MSDKNETLRSQERPLPMDIKARLVVLGNLENDPNFRWDAPTGSLLAQHVVLSWAASGGGGPKGPRRQLRKKDARNAYLQGDHIERELYMRLPAGGIPGAAPGSLLRARVPIYGTGDAARGFWLKVRKTLLQCGWVQSQLEPALFLFWDGRTGKKVLTGMAVTHVDDILHCGEGTAHEASITKLLKDMGFDKLAEREFVYCGKKIVQSDSGGTVISQREVTEKLEEIRVSAERKTYMRDAQMKSVLR